MLASARSRAQSLSSEAPRTRPRRQSSQLDGGNWNRRGLEVSGSDCCDCRHGKWQLSALLAGICHNAGTSSLSSTPSATAQNNVPISVADIGPLPLSTHWAFTSAENGCCPPFQDILLRARSRLQRVRPGHSPRQARTFSPWTSSATRIIQVWNETATSLRNGIGVGPALLPPNACLCMGQGSGTSLLSLWCALRFRPSCWRTQGDR